ncbi:MAG TPA: hypothetical protein PLR56_09200 [Brevefilum sp.]|nr:hypothetical protein [Brevefilum sp.]
MAKISVGFRLSDQAIGHLEKITRATGSTKTATVETALALMANKLKGETKMKTLETLLTEDLKNTQLRYVGSIFGDADAGDEPWEGTGEEIWENLSQMFGDELNEEPFLDIHPTHSGERSGWYFQSGNLWNKGSWGEECVFEVL